VDIEPEGRRGHLLDVSGLVEMVPGDSFRLIVPGSGQLTLDIPALLLALLVALGGR